MLDCLARLVNKKSRLERMKLPLRATARFENSLQEPCLFPAEAGIVFTTLAAIGNFGCAIETNNQARKLWT